MLVHTESRTSDLVRRGFADEAEVDAFIETLGRFERGEIEPDAWRTFRLVHGVYGQRQEGVQMVRVKVPQGVLLARQLEAIAEVSERYSRGFAHVTTRQNIQLHFVRSDDLEVLLGTLADAGLTTREACGNSVRNIVGCPWSGISGSEVFDTGPYADALTRHLLRHPLSSNLPRKFKIAWEGCAEDHVALGIHDIGFQARQKGGRRGFRVTLGGGTATLCRTGQELVSFLPAADVLRVSEAVVRVFSMHGDYAHRQRNRLKFLIREMGWDAFQAEVEQQLAALRSSGEASLPFDPEAPPEAPLPLWRQRPEPAEELADWATRLEPRGPGIVPPVPSAAPEARFDEWRRTNVRPQKQDGYAAVTIRLILGDLTAGQLRVLAHLAEAFGSGEVRTSVDQNFILPWVHTGALAELFGRLSVTGLGRSGAGTAADVTSCPGAESCRLAVTQSRGLGAELTEFLDGRPDLVEAAADLSIKVSGCPNGCGQHHVAGIGFQGGMRKVAGQPVPQYFLLLGGGTDTREAQFGRLSVKIPVRRVSQALERVLVAAQAERDPDESTLDFLRRTPRERWKALLADLEELTPQTLAPEDLVDLGESRAYKHEVMDGECSS